MSSILTTVLRRTLKILGWIIAITVLLPIVVAVLLYIPPVQDWVKGIACEYVAKQTGMQITIDRFRLEFPLDIRLDDVCVVEASGDTMAMARKGLVDIRFRPLLKGDIQLKQLRLSDGYYRMVAPDTSMVMRVHVEELRVGGGTRADLRSGNIYLDRAFIKGGNVELSMSPWKSTPKPYEPGTMCIRANSLRAEDFTFAMSMLPVIDTLRVNTSVLEVTDGVVDLRSNKVTIKSGRLDKGAATYITPTARYVASHPAPPPSPYPSPPMVIQADTLALTDFSALYATKGATPVAGFDPAYMQFSDLNLTLRDFYNASSTVRLPIAALSGRERSGLTITSASGLVEVDSAGLTLQTLNVTTPYSSIEGDAQLSFAMMAMAPDGPMDVRLAASLGLRDAVAFMPSLSSITRYIGQNKALKAIVQASGSLKSMNVARLALDLPGVLSVTASGKVDNPMDIKRMAGNIAFTGTMSDPRPVQAVAGIRSVDLPPLSVKGNAMIAGADYAVGFNMRSPAGNVVAEATLGLNAERYFVDMTVSGLQMNRFAPALGLGAVTGQLYARGAGFNPTRPGAHTDIRADIATLHYKGADLGNLHAAVKLSGGGYDLHIVSDNDVLAGKVDAAGSVAGQRYEIDLHADVAHFDAAALHMSDNTLTASGLIDMTGSADLADLLFDLTLHTYDINAQIGERSVSVPRGITAVLQADDISTYASITANQINLDFHSPLPMRSVIDRMQAGVDEIMHQVIETKSLAVDEFQPLLPGFTLNFAASGNGFLRPALEMAGIEADSISVVIDNAETVTGRAEMLALRTSGVRLDTISLGVSERGKYLDYKLHLGNRPGNLDEFASVNLNGYVGQQRVSAFLNQRNVKGETGYRLGFTGAFNDSTVTVHFTPLKATIGYLPWSFNDDNYLRYDFKERFEGNILAQSANSKIHFYSGETDASANPQLHVDIENLHIADFTSMIIGMPDVDGYLNTKMVVGYDNQRFTGQGRLGVADLVYNQSRVGSFDMDFSARLDLNGNTAAEGALLIDGKQAMTLHGILRPDTLGIRPGDVGVRLTEFPLTVANAFLPKDVASLSGTLTGDMGLTGSLSKPVLNGFIRFDEGKVFLPMMNGFLALDTAALAVTDNVLAFNNFDIYAANANPLTIKGEVDARDLMAVNLDLGLKGRDFMLINNDKRARTDIYGKILLNADASVKGPMNLLDIKADVSVLSGTNATYTLSQTESLQQQQASEVVKFVNLADTLAVAHADTIQQVTSSMRILATLEISNGVQIAVNLNNNSSNRVQLAPYGKLTYFQNYMGDMRLTGRLDLGTGYARYAVPLLGEKRFDLLDDSYVLWNGQVLNPQLHIMANEQIKSVAKTENGNQRVVNFLVSLSATGTLERPNVVFDLSTDDDLGIQNELQSMSADQRSTQAMNMLLYGKYMGPGAVSSSGNLINNQLYGFLESQLNSWMANNIRGVDITFGIDQYTTGMAGERSTSTSYSYQVSKSLFDNRFKIVVGGNYSTDPSQDDNIAENLVNNVSFEYMIRQTNTMSMYVKLFRHANYESILEGEITEMGAGLVVQRKINHVRQLFSWLRPKKKRPKNEVIPSAVREVSDSVKINDSMFPADSVSVNK